MKKEFWNERYRQPEYAYGTEPNTYLARQLAGRRPGSILFAADGEGRNSVYAARLGWKVSAFDLSTEGQNKALKLADESGVQINYEVADVQQLHYEPGSFDALALIYMHLPSKERRKVHRQLAALLRPGGLLILEAFSRNHLKINTEHPESGGPTEPDMLYAVEDIRTDFEGFDIKELIETETELQEGSYHRGLASVIRFAGIKKKA